MKKLMLLSLLLGSFLSQQAQGIAYVKIAQRGDTYVGNSWKGKDSFLFTYINDTIRTSLTALQLSANNTWDNWYKYTYTINAFGKVSTQLRENWSAGNWVNSTRYTYNFDVDSNNTEILYDVWSGNNWNPTGKIEYTGYNNYGKYQNEYVSYYSGGSWIYQTRKTYAYLNNQTLKSEEDRYTWDILLNNWVKSERLFYTYFQNEIGSTTRFLPDTANVWQPKEKFIYTYNPSPIYILEYLAQKYDSVANAWYNNSRVTYSYINNLLDKTQNEVYANNSWNPTARAQHIYNGNNEKTEYFTELFNIGNWVKNIRSTYLYSNAKVSEENKFIAAGNAWEQNKRLSYNYDGNQNMIYDKTENVVSGNFIPVSQNFYYYTSYPLQYSDRIGVFSNLKLYPNPATEKIHLELDAKQSTHVQINVLDIYGKIQVLITQPVFANRNFIQIPCSSLGNGFYFIQMVDTHTGKQQIEKFQISR